MGIQNVKGYDLYLINVNRYTEKSYKKYKNIINPNNLQRSRGKYHLDHKFSKTEGFKNNISPEIIGSYINLQMLTESDNCSKCYKCSISKEELLSEYNRKIKSF
jgi:hypothetical protein